jgi:tight adherence protein C
MSVSVFAYALAVCSALLCIVLIIARLVQDADPPIQLATTRHLPPVVKFPRRLAAFWPLVELLSRPCEWLCSVLPIKQQRQGLTKAGLDESFGPAQWLAARVLLASLAAVGVLAGLILLGYQAWWFSPLVGLITFVSADLWLQQRARRRRRALLAQLPFFIDLMVICLESGLNLSAAIEQAVRQGPRGALLLELQKLAVRQRSGQSIRQALEGLSQACGLAQIDSLVSALVAAQASGSDLGPVLSALAQQHRDEHYFEAEQQAMQAPVKMLVPLLLFVFPCTFLILLFPIGMRLMSEGILK